MVTIVSRSQWGAAFPIPAGRHVSPGTRRFYVVHWPVMTSRDERQWCRDIERMHANQGWGMIGYNFLVGMSGSVYEGCGRDVRGIHSPPRNVDGWGVCVLQPSTAQGVPTAPVSAEARRGARALYDELCGVAGRRLEMSWHGQDFPTACPGPDLTAWVRGGMVASAPERPQSPSDSEDFVMATASVDTPSHTYVLELNRAGHLWCKRRAQGSDQWANLNVNGAAFNNAAGAGNEQFRQATFATRAQGNAAEVFVEKASGGVRQFTIGPDGGVGARDLP